DRLRLDLADRLDGRRDVDGIALDGAGGHDLDFSPLHRSFDAGQARLAVIVVLIKDSYLVEGLAGHLADDLFCLVEVARADIENVAVERRAQRLGAGDRLDERSVRSG